MSKTNTICAKAQAAFALARNDAQIYKKNGQRPFMPNASLTLSSCAGPKSRPCKLFVGQSAQGIQTEILLCGATFLSAPFSCFFSITVATAM